jgi:hypothetical protein
MSVWDDIEAMLNVASTIPGLERLRMEATDSGDQEALARISVELKRLGHFELPFSNLESLAVYLNEIVPWDDEHFDRPSSAWRAIRRLVMGLLRYSHGLPVPLWFEKESHIPKRGGHPAWEGDQLHSMRMARNAVLAYDWGRYLFWDEGDHEFQLATREGVIRQRVLPIAEPFGGYYLEGPDGPSVVIEIQNEPEDEFDPELDPDPDSWWGVPAHDLNALIFHVDEHHPGIAFTWKSGFAGDSGPVDSDEDVLRTIRDYIPTEEGT